ncbi:hypothetical protein K438DRAFT_1976274 [Mycena galopus ATCC 62051]|nr:hypothetical protein K438DRAFT_1976274 [Mycena galopus ATCC 62051]
MCFFLVSQERKDSFADEEHRTQKAVAGTRNSAGIDVRACAGTRDIPGTVAIVSEHLTGSDSSNDYLGSSPAAAPPAIGSCCRANDAPPLPPGNFGILSWARTLAFGDGDGGPDRDEGVGISTRNDTDKVTLALPEGTECTGVHKDYFGACIVASQLDSSSGAATALSTSAAAKAPAATTTKVPCSSSRKRRARARASRAFRHVQGLHVNPLFASTLHH